jgi:hypothetical protein
MFIKIPYAPFPTSDKRPAKGYIISTPRINNIAINIDGIPIDKNSFI